MSVVFRVLAREAARRAHREGRARRVCRGERYQRDVRCTPQRSADVASVGNHLKVTHPEAEAGGSATMYDPYVESWTYVPRKVVRSDATIARDIQAELASTPFVDPKAVNVQVQGGTATLTGEVSNWKQRTAATRDAFEGGAVAVDNKLQVK